MNRRSPEQIAHAERRLARDLYPGLDLPHPDDTAAWDQLAAEGRQMAAERGLDLERMGLDAEVTVAKLLRQERSA